MDTVTEEDPAVAAFMAAEQPQVGWQVMADNPGWAHLAEPAPAVRVPVFLSDLLDADDQADAEAWREDAHRLECLDRWEADARLIVRRIPAPGSAHVPVIAQLAAGMPGIGLTELWSVFIDRDGLELHARMSAWTDTWLPAGRQEAEAAEAAFAARHPLVAIEPPGDGGEPVAAEPDGAPKEADPAGPPSDDEPEAA